MSFSSRDWLHEVAVIAEAIPFDYVDNMLDYLSIVRIRRGRVFVIGVGGSAANAAHAVNDLRRIGGIEAYAPSDNVAELTALANDCGWETVFEEWLKESRLSANDAILVLSVNGGTDRLSQNIVAAVRYARNQDATVLAIVGRRDGYATRYAHEFVAIPCPNEDHRTPHAESFQAVIWHLLCYGLRERRNASVSASPSREPILK